MGKIFDRRYADVYDAIYRDKDYMAECDLLEGIFRSYSGEGTKSILDLGCGTGNHAIPLALRGHNVVGVDRSRSMLSKAERKVAENSAITSLRFYQGDVRTVDLDETFDVALMMFAVLSYQIANADVLSVLKTARRHLRPDALLIFDVWYGPAVVSQGPSERRKIVPTDDGEILRLSSGELDGRNCLCKVHFQLSRFKKDRLVEKSEETHELRYFFPGELNAFLGSSGFIPEHLGAFPRFESGPDETTWNVLQVARAV